MEVDSINSQDIGIEHVANTPRPKGRRRQNNRTSSAIDIDVPPKPFILKINPYVVSAQNALDLMAKICSAEPSDKAINWVAEISHILDEFSFSNLVNNNRSLLSNPTFDKDIVSLFDNALKKIVNSF